MSTNRYHTTVEPSLNFLSTYGTNPTGMGIAPIHNPVPAANAQNNRPAPPIDSRIFSFVEGDGETTNISPGSDYSNSGKYSQSTRSSGSDNSKGKSIPLVKIDTPRFSGAQFF